MWNSFLNEFERDITPKISTIATSKVIITSKLVTRKIPRTIPGNARTANAVNSFQSTKVKWVENWSALIISEIGNKIDRVSIKV